ncbi:MAG TPA: carbohydrate-binding family V/XII [Thermoanaerobaculia bacterium]|nr:carbohydrate-binding family V/XII [Thermoanaerobaculia bacterium]
MRNVRSVSILRLPLLVLLAFFVGRASADDDPGWPREIPLKKGTVTIYQPQIESMTGDVVRARSAVSYQGNDKKEPVFGVTWFLAKVRTDRDSRTVTLSDPLVERTRFPNITPEREKKFADLVGPRISPWIFTMSLDRFTAALSSAEKEQKSAQGLKADPPKIIVRNEPAVLILIDGEPKTQEIPQTRLQRVVNTPAAILTDGRQFYTSNGTFWYAAPAATGPFTTIPKPPADVENAVREALAKAPKDPNAEPESRPDSPPEIVVSTEPAELISFEGAPNWKPITGTNLLFAENTASDVFKDIDSQETFVLAAGRWYSSRSFGGPWAWVPADKLPKDFSRIPPESAKSDARASVAGTDEAEDALLDAQIPQTTAIDRESARLEVTYDGEPRFEAIPGAGIEYAINTPTSVLKVRGRYYACDQAVWYVSSSPTGPWAVSDSRPDEVEAIPPSSPVYNVKYVYVYDSTPSVVYVGYTPGYVGCYPWGPTVVWGTGYWYRPWYGVHYYPRPYTYGLAVHYNPWTGWSMGFGWSYGFLSFGLGWNVGGGWYGHGGTYSGWHGGWYGPGGYRPPYYGHGYAGYRPPGYRPPPAGTARPTPYASNNLYSRPANKQRNAPEAKLPQRRSGREAPLARDRAPAPGDAKPGAGSSAGTRDVKRPATRDAARPAARPDDVFADRNGNVYRKSADQWQKRDKGGWQSDPAASQKLQRDAAARDRGNQKTQSFQQSRPQAPSRPQSSKPATSRPQPAKPPASRPQGGGGKKQ